MTSIRFWEGHQIHWSLPLGTEGVDSLAQARRLSRGTVIASAIGDAAPRLQRLMLVLIAALFSGHVVPRHWFRGGGDGAW